jgi:hypothetical protein
MSQQSESSQPDIGRSAALTGARETSGWSLESLRSRVFFKMMDAALTARLEPRQATGRLLLAILSVRSSHYKRVASTINLADQVIPGTSQRLSDALVSADKLPLAIENFRLMSYGSGSTVFLLDTYAGQMVLKIFRRSLGKQGRSLLNIADEFQAKYRTIVGWFNEADIQLVPPALFLILHGPLLRKPAAATLQPFIHGKKKDLFQDYRDDELLAIFESDPSLGRQFVFFAQKVLDVAAAEGRCMDFIGRDNVLLVEDQAGCSLAVIDNGIFNLEHIRKNNPHIYQQIQAYLERLGRLLHTLNPKPYPKKGGRLDDQDGNLAI